MKIYRTKNTEWKKYRNRKKKTKKIQKMILQKSRNAEGKITEYQNYRI